MKQERVSKRPASTPRQADERTTEPVQVDETQAAVSSDVRPEDTAAVIDNIDELLDEIDESGILENAEEFVKGYVQKGGE